MSRPPWADSGTGQAALWYSRSRSLAAGTVGATVAPLSPRLDFHTRGGHDRWALRVGHLHGEAVGEATGPFIVAGDDPGARVQEEPGRSSSRYRPGVGRDAADGEQRHRVPLVGSCHRRDVVATDSGGCTVIDRAAAAESGGLSKSVTVTVKSAVPLADGVPEMTPVLGSRARPGRQRSRRDRPGVGGGTAGRGQRGRLSTTSR